jgi:hypothetical protein
VRGGLAGETYVWGHEFKPGGKFMANTYQGQIPVKDAGEEGFAGISPVRSFPPNAYGRYDMAGNVWQWCSDRYRSDYFQQQQSRNSRAARRSAPTGLARRSAAFGRAGSPSRPPQGLRVFSPESYLGCRIRNICIDYCGILRVCSHLCIISASICTGRERLLDEDAGARATSLCEPLAIVRPDGFCST